MVTTESELQSALHAIRTLDGVELHDAIAHGLALTGYVCPARPAPIPLASELSDDQRAVMEAIATRSGLGYQTVRAFRLPDPVQVRRRWLGIDPPGILESSVDVPMDDGPPQPMPLWRALQPTVPPASDPMRGLLVTELEKLQFLVAICEGSEPPYGIERVTLPLLGDAPDLRDDPDALAWAKATFERFIAPWLTTDDDGRTTLQRHFLKAPDSGHNLFEMQSSTWRMDTERRLLATLIRSAVITELDALYDCYVTLSGADAAVICDALPADTKDEFLVWHFDNLVQWKVQATLRLLPRVPNRALAERLASYLESVAFLRDNGVASVEAATAAWNKLEAQLPNGVWRPLVPPLARPRLAAREPDALPAASPPALAAMTTSELTIRALADLAVFVQLAGDDRLRIAAHVARELGPRFAPASTLIGDRHLAGVRHVASDYLFVLLPGETFDMGMTDKDLAELDTWFADYGLDDQDDWREWLAPQIEAARPVRTLNASPIAFGSHILGREVTNALLGHPAEVRRGVWPSITEPLALARAAGFDLPTEAEWERAARDGEGATFDCDAARIWFGGAPLRYENRSGLTMHFGEWVADDWHPNFQGAPDRMAGWLGPDRNAAPTGVFRGKFCIETTVRDEEAVPFRMNALRAPINPDTVMRPPNEFVRLVLRPDTQGRWHFTGPDTDSGRNS